jgi:hypothetical protein
MPFVIAKKLEHGTTNAIVARLTLQTLEILKQCNVTKDEQEKIGSIYIDSLVKKNLRCWEIEQRLRAEFGKKLASYKPPAPGAVSVELPQIPRLEEECHNFLYEAKNYLRDLLQVFNLLYGTNYKEASEWVRASKAAPSVMDFAAKTFGEKHVNTVFFRQMPTCIEPFIDMRNAVEHPKGRSGELKITNIAFDSGGKLAAPVWSREKDDRIEYGPLVILDDLRVGIHNLLILGEDVLIVWAMTHLAMPGVTAVTVVPESKRDPGCPIRYRIAPSAALLHEIAKAESGKGQTSKFSRLP